MKDKGTNTIANTITNTITIIGYGIALLALLLTIAWFSKPAQADEFTLYLSGITEHYVPCDNCTEVNWGASLRMAKGNDFWQGGVFLNSYNNWAFFVARGLSTEWHGVTFSAGAGLVHGYDRYGSVIPFAVGMAEYGPVYAAIIPGSVTFGFRIPL